MEATSIEQENANSREFDELRKTYSIADSIRIMGKRLDERATIRRAAARDAAVAKAKNDQRKARRAPRMQKGHVNNCGSLNLNTGKNDHFNVITDWAGFEDGLMILFKSDDMTAKNPYRVVGGCGEYAQGEAVELVSARNERRLGMYEAVMTVPANAAGMARIKAMVEKNDVTFGTWD